MQRKLVILIVFLMVMLSACTIEFQVPTTPTTGPTTPVEQTTPAEPVEPQEPDTGSETPEPQQPDVQAPVFNDPADLLVDAKFDILASPNGSGDCLTIQTPCTLEKAAKTVRPGQTLMLRGGLYPAGVEVKVDSEEATPLIITAFPNEVPIIDGSYNPQVPGLTLSGDNFVIRHVDFRYNWTGLLVTGDSNELENLHAYANRVEGIATNGIRNIMSHIESNDNGIGLKVDGAVPFVRYSEFTNNEQGLLVSADNPTVEYILVHNNEQGIVMSEGTLRFSVGLYNQTSFLTVSNSLVYNNTVIGGLNSFVSSTVAGQKPTIFLYNLTYDTDIPQLETDTTLYNSWQMGIVDPLFVTLDEDSPLFAHLNETSPALNPPRAEGVPIGNLVARVGAYGTP